LQGDFGVAWHTSLSDRFNPARVLAGAPDYQPPETVIHHTNSDYKHKKFGEYERPAVTRTEKNTNKHLVWQIAMVVNDARYLETGTRFYRGSYVNEEKYKKNDDHFVPLSDAKKHDDDALGELL
jgi:hypothetical protein